MYLLLLFSLDEAAFSAKMYELCEETIWKLIDINPDCREYILKAHKLYQIQDKDINILFDSIQNGDLGV